MKGHLGINDLLRSQTPETAAQEVAAMIVGSSLIAHERAKLKPGEPLQHRVSFIKTRETLEPLWLTLRLGADILREDQKQALGDRFYALAAHRVMAKNETVGALESCANRSSPGRESEINKVLKVRFISPSSHLAHEKLPKGIRLKPGLQADRRSRQASE